MAGEEPVAGGMTIRYLTFDFFQKTYYHIFQCHSGTLDPEFHWISSINKDLGKEVDGKKENFRKDILNSISNPNILYIPNLVQIGT